MTEEKVMKVDWKKFIPLVVGLFIGVVLMIFLFSNLSMERGVSVPLKVIGEETDKVLMLENPHYENLDLDAIFDEKLESNVLAFQLKSHPSVDYVKQVGTGNQVVMWYDINSIYQLENALGTPEFTDMRTGELVEREWRYVIWNEETCNEVVLVNGTTIKECVLGHWTPYESKNLLKGLQRIGVEVLGVEKGDWYDVVWVVGEKRIEKHAEFNAVGDVYYKSFTPSGSFPDTGLTEFTDGSYPAAGTGNAGWFAWDTTVSGGIGNITVDLGTVSKAIYNITAWMMTNTVSSIYLPSNLTAWGSNDNSTFTLLGELTFSGGDATSDTGRLATLSPDNVDYRYIRYRGVQAQRWQFWGEGGINWTYSSPELDVDLVSPVNNTNFTTQNINLNGTVFTYSNGLLISNVTLLIDESVNQYNNSGHNGTYNFSVTLSDGSYNWTIQALGNDSVWYNASNGTLGFDIDTINPALVVTYPNETITFHELNTNLSLNWSVNDTHLDSCWFDWNNANTTVTCNDNSTSFNITDRTLKNLTFWANDTFGNTNSSFVIWDYRLFLESETFESEVWEGTTTTFSANFYTNGSSITQGNLSYNSTENLGTINDHGGNNFTVSETVNVLSVASDTNLSFYWNITQGGFYYALGGQNQTVFNLNIDNCSAETHVLYNFTLVDEEEQTTISGSGQNTSGKIDLQITSPTTGLEINSFNKSYSKINPFAVCLNTNLSNGQNFLIDVQIQYGADDYETEFYHIQNETINTSSFPTNITLYDLNSSDSQLFEIIFRDSSFLVVHNALVEVHRKYVDEGVFKIVEIPRTDSQGKTAAHLMIQDAIYNFVIKKYGVTLGTFSNVVAVCQNPAITSCVIDFNAFADELELPDFEEAEDFSFTLGYDNSTRVISSVYSIPSGTTATVSLNVTREDTLGTAVCSDQLTSSSGTLSCIVPTSFGNSTIRAELYKANSLQAQGSIKLDKNPYDIYGVVLIGLSIFLMMTLIGVGVSNNPIITVIFLMVGVVLLFSLNLVSNKGFIGATATILWLVVALLIIIIKGARRN